MKMRLHRPSAAVLLSLSAACGGSGGATGPNTPPPTTLAPGVPATVVLFQDENGNGTLESGEALRVPDVEVQAAGRTARSAPGSGIAELSVPPGTHAVTLRAETLPPFYAAGAPASVTAPMSPAAGPYPVPVTLQIARGLRPTMYVAFGDSVTRGENVPAGSSYPARLQSKLSAHFGFATVNNRGADATNSFEAVERVQNNIGANQPAYTLIMYGTNDWNTDFCQESLSCPTAENLRRVVRYVKGIGSLPFLATIPPVNPALQPHQRNEWIDGINAQLKAMAQQEGAFVVDLNQAFKSQPTLSALFADHVHPNAAGYDLIASTFFEAIAHGRSVP
jgi:lysophospholipase L1-like esterase